MNKDYYEGNWTEFKGKVREKYGKLSDDEIEETKGSMEQLSGKIQQKYGESKESVMGTLDSTFKSLKDKLS